MTQLVELQSAMPKFDEAGIKLYALSYDEVGALKDFAANHDISFELLSDEGSHVIREFGILNHHVTEEQVPYHGIPFPGTYLVDEAGMVTAKSFHATLSQRESAEGLIDAALGQLLLRSDEPTTAQTESSGIGFSLTYHGGGGVIRGGSIRTLVLRVTLPDGLHLYDDPVPEGMVATSFTLIGPEGLNSMPIKKPQTRPLVLPGLGELQVWSGQVDFMIPVYANDQIASLVRADNPDHVTIEVDVRYQACNDTSCLFPRTERLTLDVPVAPFIGPALANGMPGAVTTSMDTTKWFMAMVKRSLESTPDPDAAMAYLSQTRANYQAGPLGTDS